MNIGIIGGGNMGRGLAHTLARAGQKITLYTRNPEQAAPLVQEVRQAVPKADIKAAALEKLEGEIVVFAVAYSAALELAEQYRSQLAGRVVIDITNPLNETYTGLLTTPGTSAAENIKARLPSSHVVKAFNTTFAGTLVTGRVAGEPLDVFVAGDDAQAKEAVLEIIKKSGLRGLDVGPLERARQLEEFALFTIMLQFSQGTSFMSAWKLLT